MTFDGPSLSRAERERMTDAERCAYGAEWLARWHQEYARRSERVRAEAGRLGAYEVERNLDYEDRETLAHRDAVDDYFGSAS